MQKATRVLVVDDFKTFREWIRSQLKPHIQVDIVGEASTGQDAIQMAEDLNPDLILLDLGLPDINGIETAKRISSIRPLAKILFLSGCAECQVVERGLSHGNGCLFKGDAGRELVPLIQAVMRGEPFVNSAGTISKRRTLPSLNLILST